ncbi:hypothetical protein [Candidatus Williamhamiltonella defendens]|uniref:Integrase n=1 Tax=Candidatus Hamiltonella defensa (Bemisia tabaci) TaxID=672795 RepID=A0A249DWK0_9ENTR|nr:hypothetical protein [Candidatus Hamiltonella defensa]ASX25904.1 hypothetical protein BA171_01820 [Candidatus Hamiltonella defensa (Bemisia tabaci)]
MAYYNMVKRPRADGTVRYRLTAGVKEGDKHLHRETRTFGKLAQARTWGAKRVAELEENGVPNSNDISILSCMRVVEVYKIRWEDVDEKQKAVLVRDIKAPRKKSGNHILVPLLAEARAMCSASPKPANG